MVRWLQYKDRIMKLKAKIKASKWTKDRLSRHPGPFTEEKRGFLANPQPPHTDECVLVQEIETGWLGWFPLSEVDILA
jgi:hypothetical protein